MLESFYTHTDTRIIWETFNALFDYFRGIIPVVHSRMLSCDCGLDYRRSKNRPFLQFILVTLSSCSSADSEDYNNRIIEATCTKGGTKRLTPITWEVSQSCSLLTAHAQSYSFVAWWTEVGRMRTDEHMKMRSKLIRYRMRCTVDVTDRCLMCCEWIRKDEIILLTFGHFNRPPIVYSNSGRFFAINQNYIENHDLNKYSC